MQQQQLFDTFGRLHNYLRISLTDACNLRCTYCMPEESATVTAAKKLMQPDEIFAISEEFVKCGVNKIRLTGGEPLVRKEAGLIMKKLSALPVELSISTNAVLVDKFIDDFKAAGIRSVNVSLDTLDEALFFQITKRGDFARIYNNILLLLQNEFIVKLNIVVMKGVNEGAIFDFVNLTKDFPLDVRFIEFMPFQGNRWNREKVISKAEMLSLISGQFRFDKLPDGINDTARMFLANGHKGRFGFISTITEPFCDGCNRLRLTADGKIKNCLFSQSETDLLGAYRSGAELRPLIQQNLSDKMKELGGRGDMENIENRSMIRIGG